MQKEEQKKNPGWLKKWGKKEVGKQKKRGRGKK
jgi:hypothetical protein